MQNEAFLRGRNGVVHRVQVEDSGFRYLCNSVPDQYERIDFSKIMELDEDAFHERCFMRLPTSQE